MMYTDLEREVAELVLLLRQYQRQHDKAWEKPTGDGKCRCNLCAGTRATLALYDETRG